MFDTQAVAISFGKAAGQYDQHAHLQQQVRSHLLKVALPYWTDDTNVLDLGCGTGALREEARTHRKHISLVGLDVAAGMCSMSRARNLPVVQALAQAVPFASGSFDLVFSSLMLQWLSHPTLAFAEIARLLRPGGTAAIATLTDGTLKELKSAFAALDGLPHISDFHMPHSILCCAEQGGMQLCLARQKTIIEYYPDTIALMRSIKAIGASNKHKGRSKGMMTPAKLAKLEQMYNTRYGRSQGLPASWQVLTMVLRKGQP
ncbi:MAG: methyltransferase domain-containing protein [Alphaproteobacteria bacterium]